MYIMKVEITYLEGNKKVYEVGAAVELSCESGTYLVMRRLKDGEFRFIPTNIIESWKVLERA